MLTKRDLLVAAAGAILSLGAMLAGCQEVNTRNDPLFVDAADRFVNKTVGPEYETYVMNDAALGSPGEVTPAREDRLQNVRTFRQAVEQAQLETAETDGAADRGG